jgi:hypothetical protein
MQDKIACIFIGETPFSLWSGGNVVKKDKYRYRLQVGENSSINKESITPIKKENCTLTISGKTS